MSCETCEQADRLGWLGRDGAHCRRCHRDWWGTAQMHCVTCCRHFTSASTCEKHMLPHGCSDPATMVHGPKTAKAGEPVFHLVERRGGPTWALSGLNPHSLDYKMANP
jgi:hypothetical protein